MSYLVSFQFVAGKSLTFKLRLKFQPKRVSIIIKHTVVAAEYPRRHVVHLFLDLIKRSLIRQRRRPRLDIAGTNLHRIQEKCDIHLLLRNPGRDGGDPIRQATRLGRPARIIEAAEDRLELLEGKLDVLHNGLQLAHVAGRLGPVQYRFTVTGLAAEVAQGYVHLADGDGDIVKGRGGRLLDAQVEGAGKGVGGVDADGGGAAAHGGRYW